MRTPLVLAGVALLAPLAPVGADDPKPLTPAQLTERALHRRAVADTARPSRASITAGVQKNADGSVDVYFGPKAPAGKESNWVQTDPKGKFELLFRLYGPEKAFFDKTWKLPDAEEVK